MLSFVAKNLRFLGIALAAFMVADSLTAAEPVRQSRGAASVANTRGVPANSAMAAPTPEARVGMRMPGAAAPAPASAPAPAAAAVRNAAETTDKTENKEISGFASAQPSKAESSSDGTVDNCKDNYFNCMDQFCLMDSSQGERCACSARISEMDELTETILGLQSEAERLMNEGVEREMLGAQAELAFAANGTQKKATRTLSFDFEDEYDSEDSEDVTRRGAVLYEYAAGACKDRLDKCGADADMVKTLYGQQVSRDCGSYDSYLKSQKKLAEDNKFAAEREVRKTRVENLDKTNRYNRGECLIALRDCVATKGGCGTNFENCLDAKLLTRRSNACENILDQCLAVRDYVQKDWQEEQKTILAEAAKYADRNRRGTCLARVDACLEESCAPTINDQCLTDVRIARGVCPVMDECNELVPGISAMYASRLEYMRVRFCQNDLTSCFQERCGENFNNPACVGKNSEEISEMCPQRMFPSCAGMRDFAAIQNGVYLQVDYQLMQGCMNNFAEKLNSICGMDMNCLPETLGAPRGINITSGMRPREVADMIAQFDAYDYRADVKTEVDKFFAQMQNDPTIAACKGNLGNNIFTSAKLLGQTLAEQRAGRNYVRKLAELTKQADVETARKQCEDLPKKEKSGGSKITSVTFEPALRNCHVCRVQEVEHTGGESTGAGAMKGAAGGMAAGAGIGSAIGGPWGTAIGAGVGAIAGGIFGGMSAKETTFQEELTSCEDINM